MGFGRRFRRFFRRTAGSILRSGAGIIDNVLGTNISGDNGLPSLDVSQAETGIIQQQPDTPTTPTQSTTTEGTSGDGKFSDVTSIFDALSTSEEDEWDKLLGRKFSKK